MYSMLFLSEESKLLHLLGGICVYKIDGAKQSAKLCQAAAAGRGDASTNIKLI
jgi:hypothetical protein